MLIHLSLVAFRSECKVKKLVEDTILPVAEYKKTLNSVFRPVFVDKMRELLNKQFLHIPLGNCLKGTGKVIFAKC